MGWRGVWVLAEAQGDRLAPVSLELLGAGRRLADALAEPLAAVALGANAAGLAGELAEHGADLVHTFAESGAGQCFAADCAAGLTGLARRLKPAVILCGATSLGRALAPRLAALLGAGLTADCTALGIDPGSRRLVATKPAFGERLLAEIAYRAWPQMATVRPGVLPPADRQTGRRAEVIAHALPPAPQPRCRLLAATPRQHPACGLAQAEAVVAVGRGLGGPKNLSLARELARLLGAAIAATRPAVEAGWLPPECQVGQTGVSIAPRLYVALGISGAVQHLAGVRPAGAFVAVNRDPQAPVFAAATHAIVGDLGQVLPALIRAVRG